MILPNLFLYSDYRQYLRDFYGLNKASEPTFSFRYLSLKAGINSSAFYKYVIEGKRNLNKNNVLKTCLALGLRDREAEYFENLVFFNQAKTIKEKNLFFDRLTRSRGFSDPKHLEEHQYAFYGEWYHSAVRELLNIVPIDGGMRALAQALSPPITQSQARESVDLLRTLGLIQKDNEGRWRPVDPVLTTGNPIGSQVIINHQIKMLKLAQEAYDRFTLDERLMSATTFSIPESSLSMVKAKIRDFKASLLEFARTQDNPDVVYHLNLNFFPLSKTPSKAAPKKNSRGPR